MNALTWLEEFLKVRPHSPPDTPRRARAHLSLPPLPSPSPPPLPRRPALPPTPDPLPPNHLSSQAWEKTVVIVSHDRNFLNTVTTQTIFLHRKRLWHAQTRQPPPSRPSAAATALSWRDMRYEIVWNYDGERTRRYYGGSYDTFLKVRAEQRANQAATARDQARRPRRDCPPAPPPSLAAEELWRTPPLSWFFSRRRRRGRRSSRRSSSGSGTGTRRWRSRRRAA